MGKLITCDYPGCGKRLMDSDSDEPEFFKVSAYTNLQKQESTITPEHLVDPVSFELYFCVEHSEEILRRLANAKKYVKHGLNEEVRTLTLE